MRKDRPPCTHPVQVTGCTFHPPIFPWAMLKPCLLLVEKAGDWRNAALLKTLCHWDSSGVGGKQCFPTVPIESCLHQTEVSSSHFFISPGLWNCLPVLWTFFFFFKWPLLAWMETSESLSSVSGAAPLWVSTGPVNRLQAWDCQTKGQPAAKGMFVLWPE